LPFFSATLRVQRRPAAEPGEDGDMTCRAVELLAPELDGLIELVVVEVASGSTAEKAGLSLGDVLIGAGGQFFNAADDLASTPGNAVPGHALQLDFTCDGEHMACDMLVHVCARMAIRAPVTKTDHRTLGQGDGAKRHAFFPSANKTERLASLCCIIPLTKWTRRIVRVWYAFDQLCPALRMSAGVQFC
jgi:hypothetical protein